MPFKKKYPARRKPYVRRRKAPARRKTYAKSQNLKTMTQTFKSFDNVATGPTGQVFDLTSPSDLFTAGQGFATWKSLFEQYKVLSLKVTYRPWGVGNESSGIFTTNERGSAVSWIDPDSVPTAPSSINGVISRNSLRFHDPRKMITRTIKRPAGYPAWADCQNLNYTDPWKDATIALFSQGGAVNASVYTVVSEWRVVFRGRADL